MFYTVTLAFIVIRQRCYSTYMSINSWHLRTGEEICLLPAERRLNPLAPTRAGLPGPCIKRGSVEERKEVNKC